MRNALGGVCGGGGVRCVGGELKRQKIEQKLNKN